MKYELRPYQKQASIDLNHKLRMYKIAYLHGEVRIGKTISVLETCKLYDAKKVLFVTKKKAISSIKSDYEKFEYTFELTIINYESIHKVELDFDLLVLDESHSIASFPKPSKQCKYIRKSFSYLPIILLTGTPAVESGSQWFHQLHVSNFSPFEENTFYQWAKKYVEVYEINYGNGYPTKKYDKANRELIQKVIDPYIVTITQEDAGFTTKIKENILRCEMKPITYKIANKLLSDRVVKGKDSEILGETPVKLMSKLHQIYNGTCITEDEKTIIIDNSKAKFVKNHFKGKKIAIFYYFKAELDLLKETYGENITTELEEFNTTSKNIALQQSGLEGMNLSKADYLVYYNFAFSGKNFIQSRDRMTIKTRLENEIYFIFEKKGINEKIYKQVKEKRSYNIKQFNKEYSYNEANGQD